jgi:hypothetical protein
VEDQFRRYLPDLSGAAISVETDGDSQVLRWYDVKLDADCTLEMDAATGRPRRFLQRTRSAGLLLTVVYLAWNSPVTIPAAPEPSS